MPFEKKVENSEILAQFDELENELGRKGFTPEELAEGLDITGEAVRQRLMKLEGEEIERIELSALTLWKKKGEKVFADGGWPRKNIQLLLTVSTINLTVLAVVLAVIALTTFSISLATVQLLLSIAVVLAAVGVTIEAINLLLTYGPGRLDQRLARIHHQLSRKV